MSSERLQVNTSAPYGSKLVSEPAPEVRPDVREVQQRYVLLFALKVERITVRLERMTRFGKKAGKELLLFCAGGCLCGAGIGFFMFSHLGFPKDINLTGYLSGLFLVAGAKFGFSVWFIRGLVSLVARHLQRSKSASERA